MREMRCKHGHHDGLCGAPITREIRVGNGTYDPIGSFYREILEDVCRCEGDHD